jgi:hypothetical protein
VHCEYHAWNEGQRRHGGVWKRLRVEENVGGESSFEDCTVGKGSGEIAED